MSIRYTFATDKIQARDLFHQDRGFVTIVEASRGRFNGQITLFRGTKVVQNKNILTIWTDEPIPVGKQVVWDVVRNSIHAHGFVYPYSNVESFLHSYKAVCDAQAKCSGRIVSVMVDPVTFSTWEVEEVV